MALERESVVRAALALLNEVGLDGLTVRRLAERLGVQNPALYWHFKNKQELLDRMAEVMFADAFAGLVPPAGDDWAAWLTDIARRFRSALLSYRDGARVIVSADLTTTDQWVALDLALGVLTAAGFELRTAFMGIITIFNYTVGAAFEQQGEPSHPIAGPREAAALVDPARLPMLAAAFQQMADGEAGDRNLGFEEGVQLILAGMRSARMSIDKRNN